MIFLVKGNNWQERHFLWEDPSKENGKGHTLCDTPMNVMLSDNNVWNNCGLPNQTQQFLLTISINLHWKYTERHEPQFLGNIQQLAPLWVFICADHGK